MSQHEIETPRGHSKLSKGRYTCEMPSPLWIRGTNAVLVDNRFGSDSKSTILPTNILRKDIVLNDWNTTITHYQSGWPPSLQRTLKCPSSSLHQMSGDRAPPTGVYNIEVKMRRGMGRDAVIYSRQ